VVHRLIGRDHDSLRNIYIYIYIYIVHTHTLYFLNQGHTDDSQFKGTQRGREVLYVKAKR
jgi:hypothetical protein